MTKVIDHETNKCTVILVDATSLEQEMMPTTGMVAPRYNRERDEPAFQRTWDRMNEMKAMSQLNPVPPPPTNGIRLRGAPAKDQTHHTKK